MIDFLNGMGTAFALWLAATAYLRADKAYRLAQDATIRSGAGWPPLPKPLPPPPDAPRAPRRAALLFLLLLSPALASAQGAIGVAGGGGGGGGAIPECSGDQAAFGVCLDTSTGNLIWEGATADAFEATLSFVDPTADYNITPPNATTTLAGLAIAQTWTAVQDFGGAGQALFPAGTQAAPGMAFSGNADAGWRNRAANRVTIAGSNIAPGIEFDTGGAYISSTASIYFLAGALGFATDSGFTRDSAGVVRVTNGSSGRGSLIVGGAAGIQLVDDGTKPTCDATTRGTEWHENGGAGVADTREVCAKNSSDTYAWHSLATIP